MASNLGVIYMIKRIKQNPLSSRAAFEKTALRITGFGFYALVLTLATGIIFSLLQGHKPVSTLGGIIISLLSIGVMYVVATSQIKTGRALNSDAIVADAKCTMVCIYMSVVLLLSSAVYQLSGFAYADVLGAAGLIYYSIKEGKEALDKAKGKECCSHCS